MENHSQEELAAIRRNLTPDTISTAAAQAGIDPMQAIRYSQALLGWAWAGFPTRSQEEVMRIEAICRECRHYKRNRCRKCRCRVSVSRIPIVNKAKMATEHCPEGRWKPLKEFEDVQAKNLEETSSIQ